MKACKCAASLKSWIDSSCYMFSTNYNSLFILRYSCGDCKVRNTKYSHYAVSLIFESNIIFLFEFHLTIQYFCQLNTKKYCCTYFIS